MGRYRYWNNHVSEKAALSRSVGGFDKDILDEFYKLRTSQFDHLIALYKQEYGASAASYARKTYDKWKYGQTSPSGQTIGRLLATLPRVLDMQVKCDLLRRLRILHRKKDTVTLTVDTTNWREMIGPVVSGTIRKAYSSDLPEIVKKRLTWLASSDMVAANALLIEAEYQEGKIAVSLLDKEFANIENLLSSLEGRKKISHTIVLPYGTIHLTIKKGKNTVSEKDNYTGNQSLFRPSAKDIIDSALMNLDENQARQISEQAAREAIGIEIERRRAENKVEQSRQDMDTFIDNADRMQRRGHDYKMTGDYESASGRTRVEVSRHNTTAIIVVAVVIGIVALLIYFGR